MDENVVLTIHENNSYLTTYGDKVGLSKWSM